AGSFLHRRKIRATHDKLGEYRTAAHLWIGAELELGIFGLNGTKPGGNGALADAAIDRTAFHLLPTMKPGRQIFEHGFHDLGHPGHDIDIAESEPRRAGY